MQVNRLRLNPSKTEFLWCATSRRSHCISAKIFTLADGIQSVKEPARLSRSDGKRPDGFSLIPWQGGKCHTCDVTVADTLAATYHPSASTTAGSVAEGADSRKDNKYSAIASLMFLSHWP